MFPREGRYLARELRRVADRFDDRPAQVLVDLAVVLEDIDGTTEHPEGQMAVISRRVEQAKGEKAVAVAMETAEREMAEISRRHRTAMVAVARARIRDPLIARIVAEWRAARRMYGDKQALRWVRQGEETGVRRPPTVPQLHVLAAAAAEVRRQLAESENRNGVEWKRVQDALRRDRRLLDRLERLPKTRRSKAGTTKGEAPKLDGSLETFTRWLRRHGDGWLEILPKRKHPNRRRARR
jgi:hypothetical protein